MGNKKIPDGEHHLFFPSVLNEVHIDCGHPVKVDAKIEAYIVRSGISGNLLCISIREADLTFSTGMDSQTFI